MASEEQVGLEIVWGAAAIAAELKLSRPQVYYLLSRKEIKAARRVGGRWCADIAGLRAQFTPPEPDSEAVKLAKLVRLAMAEPAA